jgi:eukaryotic-like serine/threonine-protein kinase
MLFARGTRLGPYQLVDEIGSGGMGLVFRALDTRLDRNVAIKVLPQSRWSDPDFRHRFEREARVTSSLSHPNICALFDVGSVPTAEGTAPYLVMELLEGGTLRDHLDRGRLGTRRALAYGVQVAHGLAAAHEKGLIHRDLKPENVFITRDERVKILDFGVAKAQPSNADARDTTAMRTEPGLVIGTAHYMSPEQTRGDLLDARSDIFAFGVVLYEMLAGRVPFHARSPVETMHKILLDEAPELPADVPEVAADIVRRCLEKDPARRFSSAHDLAFALESATKGLVTTTPKPRRLTVPHVQSVRAPKLIALALILGGLVAAVLLTRGLFDNEPVDPPRLRTLTSSGRDSAPTASKDGKLIAFVSARDGRSRIWLKQLADGTEVAITSGPEDSAPRFSPDGSLVLFTRAENGRNSLYRVAVLGGEPRKIIDDAFNGDFSHDAKEIAFIRNRVEKDRLSILCIARVDGGNVRELAATTRDDFWSPRWSPDRRWIAVTQQPRATIGGSVLLIHLASGNRRLLTRKEPHGEVSGVAWVGPESIVYAQVDDVLRRRGGSSVILQDVTDEKSRVLLRSPHGAAGTVDVAGEGRLVLSEDLTRQNLQEWSGGAMRWLSHGMSMDRQPTFAHNGKSIVFTSDRGGSADVWELALDTMALRRLTDHDAIDWDPILSADGKTLYWSSNRGGHFEVWRATSDGTSPQQATHDGGDAENPSLPADGDWIYYDSSNPKTPDGVSRVRVSGGTAERVIAAEAAHPEVSADGQYVVYQRFEPGGRAAISIVRISDRAVFTLAEGLNIDMARARWIGATHAIAFRAPDAQGRIGIFAQDFEPGRDTSSTRRALLVDDDVPETFAISADGKHIVRSVIDEAAGIMLAEGVRW